APVVIGATVVSPEVATIGFSSVVATSGAGCAVAMSAVAIDIGYDSRLRGGCSTSVAARTIVAKAAAAASCGPRCARTRRSDRAGRVRGDRGMRHNARIGRERRRGACRFLLIEAIAKRPRSGKLGIDRERRVHLVARAALVAPVEGPAGCAQMGLKSLPAFA